MNKFLALSLLALICCHNFATNPELYEYLKKNAPYKIYKPEENPFRNWTDDELRNLCGDIPPEKKVQEKPKVEYIKDTDVPEEFDSRKNWENCVQPIRDQESCGSCWAFAASTTLSWRLCITTSGDKNFMLSPQDLVSCDENDFGCNGGSMVNAWYYLLNTGIVTDTCYPYESGSGSVPACRKTCVNEEEWVKYKAAEANVFYGPDQFKEEIQKNGPIHTHFAVYEDFFSYSGGIYKHVSGGLAGWHAVPILGWGVEDGTKFWIIQNSWGDSWGENGYFRIAEGECSVDEEAHAGGPYLELN
jgi:cathepsin B